MQRRKMGRKTRHQEDTLKCSVKEMDYKARGRAEIGRPLATVLAW